MLRNYLITALRNLVRNRLYSAVAIGGLAVGFCTAIMVGLIVRNDLTYEHFIAGHERTYAVVTHTIPGAPNSFTEPHTDWRVARLLELNAPEVEASTRIVLTDQFHGGDAPLQRGDVNGSELIYWADPNVFDLLPLPVLIGDLKTALQQPDSIVLPRRVADKYFGRLSVLGETLLIDGNAMTVRAVLEDLPVNGTHLKSGIFAAALSSYSQFSRHTTKGVNWTPGNSVLTYIRLRPGASPADVEKKAAAAVLPLYPKEYTVKLLPISGIHVFEELNPGIQKRLTVSALIAFLVLLVASINFINLMVARAVRREQEVGVRKVCGGSRWHLMVQFMGEAILAVMLSAVLAIALSTVFLPVANLYLQSGAAGDDWRDPTVLALLTVAVLIIGIIVGAYPALVLSAFQPARVLRGWSPTFAVGIRNVLVMFQFATLIVLAIAALVIFKQRDFAISDALRVGTDQVVMARVGTAVCPQSFMDQVRGLPGVLGASCSDQELLSGNMNWNAPYKGDKVRLMLTISDWHIFRVLGIDPLAGSLPSTSEAGAAPAGLVINQSAAQRLGFESPEAAIGRPLAQSDHSGEVPILAVVPDFAFYSVARPQVPAVFEGMTNQARKTLEMYGSLISIKLQGRQIPETLTAVDRIWAVSGRPGPMNRFFLDAHMQQQYLSMLRSAQIFGIFSSIAVFLSGLGLLALAAVVAEQRTKEIGVRKAMGARPDDIVRLLVWQFCKPVLWANVVAWPSGYFVMKRWLEGFAYHIELSPWMFIAASGLALVIAVSTVIGHALLVARAQPVVALRYE